jgi:hypothetical protein
MESEFGDNEGESPRFFKTLPYWLIWCPDR